MRTLTTSTGVFILSALLSNHGIASSTPEKPAYRTPSKQGTPAAFDDLPMQNISGPILPVSVAKAGDAVGGRGVHLGAWEVVKGQVVQAYAAEDFLRDKQGNQLVLTFNEAVAELTMRNGGRAYGRGTEDDIRQAIKAGVYRDGDLVLPTMRQLQEQISPLMSGGKLPRIADAAQTGEGGQRWALSGSRHPGSVSFVCHVGLADGGHHWGYEDGSRSGVLPVRLYRKPEGAKPTVTPGG